MLSIIWTEKVLSYSCAWLIVTAACLWGPAELCAYPKNEKALDPEKIFYNAKAEYISGNFEKAISGYKSVLAAGLKSGDLYYNIGNCYLKKGAVGNAILSYERAKFFIPRDGDLIINYRLAMSQIKQKDPTPRKSPVALRLDNAFDLLTIGEAIMIFAVFYYGFAIFIIIPKFIRRFRMVLILLASIFFCMAVIAIRPLIYKIERSEKLAVVVVPIADVKIEPQEESPSRFPLYEGMKAYVLKERKGWLKVKRPDGKIGWARTTDISLVNP